MTLHRFAFIKDNNIFNIFEFDSESEHPSVPRWLAGLNSGPYIVPIPEGKESDVFIGSIWDGENFHDPV